jgi:hypothetical protein
MQRALEAQLAHLFFCTTHRVTSTQVEPTQLGLPSSVDPPEGHAVGEMQSIWKMGAS